ncbi:hypothetical protein GDO86_002127 [Hymenochirus boettgeri]|uniref:Transmembrane protein 17 n=1 Tax=Hymenochirus boettgeri TaxID=247094 RepID=A0A8T2KIS8_9PIPI|nr:hypothetical protein GDO86_019445 [Hymenochirus boettgeri]KAG8429695.1 hypothetical protein GDO86_019443 [Hymenochirus boettgeri]KAG8456212.1 hypothetical protein GDO86_002127 [Hymenochirus boettgeri]
MALLTPLPGNVRQGLARISGSLFIQNKTRDCGEEHVYHTDHELLTGLPLQMMLYFNALFFPFWFISEIITLELKYTSLTTYYQFFCITALIILTFVESIRLYLGYIGNLHEKVPELAGFFLLTILIQLPLILFLLTDKRNLLLPLEIAVHGVYIAFINAEVILSFLVLKTMTRQLATKYCLRQMEDLESKRVQIRRSYLGLSHKRISMLEQHERDVFMF